MSQLKEVRLSVRTSTKYALAVATIKARAGYGIALNTGTMVTWIIPVASSLTITYNPIIQR